MKSRLNRFDHHLTAVIQSLPAVGIEPVMTAASLLGLPGVAATVGAVGLLAAAKAGLWLLFWQFLAVLAGSLTIVILKLWLKRARPLTPYVARYGLKDYSFPSGHSGGSLLIYGLIAYQAAHALAAPWATVTAATLACLIFLVGVSRVYLGAHFPSDVVGAWLFAGSWLFVVTQLRFW